MEKMCDGGPAFPEMAMQSVTHDGITHPTGGFIPLKGMTMRQYYKAAALTGIAGRALTTANLESRDTTGELATWCAAIADALLAEDSRREGKP